LIDVSQKELGYQKVPEFIDRPINQSNNEQNMLKGEKQKNYGFKCI
jgi:hypothetical protein